jgi:hypothetical protein
MRAVTVDLKPSIGRTRRLMRRWSSSMRIVDVLALADPDWLQPAPGATPQAICRVAGDDRLILGLAAVDDDAIWSTMTLQRLSEEALGGRQVAVSAEIEFDRVADAVAGAIEIHPLATDLDVRFVHMPFAGDGALALIERVLARPVVSAGLIEELHATRSSSTP